MPAGRAPVTGPRSRPRAGRVSLPDPDQLLAQKTRVRLHALLMREQLAMHRQDRAHGQGLSQRDGGLHRTDAADDRPRVRGGARADLSQGELLGTHGEVLDLRTRRALRAEQDRRHRGQSGVLRAQDERRMAIEVAQGSSCIFKVCSELARERGGPVCELRRYRRRVRTCLPFQLGTGEQAGVGWAPAVRRRADHWNGEHRLVRVARRCCHAPSSVTLLPGSVTKSGSQ